jgi:hypothetical protein
VDRLAAGGLLRPSEGSIKVLLRLYYGSIKALLRLYIAGAGGRRAWPPLLL